MELLERSDVLDQLEMGLRDAAAGRGRLIAITGQAGIGKTALVSTFVRTRASGARILSAACDDLAVPRPLGPFIDLAPVVGHDLRETLVGDPDSGSVFALVIGELERPPRPVVLVLDDLQWVDQATLDLLTYIARRIERLPVLLILSSRDDSVAATGLRRVVVAAARGVTTRAELAPLSIAAVAQMVGERAAEVHARTGGIPFYVHALKEHGVESVPGSVRDVVLAQIGGLPDETQRLLELLAIDPSGIRPTELDQASPEWERHAAYAEQAGLLVHADDAVGFMHELAREAVRDTLPTVRRRELHRQLLATLGPDADVARVVHHARAADDIARLVPASLTAARAARSLHAHEQALAHYQRLAAHLHGLPDGDVRAAVMEEHAEELLAAGQLEQAVGSLADAIRCRRELGHEREHGRLLARRASYLAQLGRHAEERAALDAALEVLEPIQPRGAELAHAYIYRASHHLDEWDLSAAHRYAESGLEVADAAGADDLRAYAMIMLGAAQAAGRQDEAGLGVLAGAVALAADIGHPGLVDAARGELVETLLDRHDLDAAGIELDHALAHAELHQHHGIHARFTVQRSRLLMYRGDLHGGLSTANEAVRATSASSLVHWQARLQAAWALTRLGDPSAGVAVADVGRKAAGLAVRFRARYVALDAEYGWLHGRQVDLQALADLQQRALRTGVPWVAGDLTRWLFRHGQPTDATAAILVHPLRATLDGDAAAASREWSARGEPYEAAMAGHDSSESAALLEALKLADGLDARPLGELIRRRLRALGIRRLPRGPLPATRKNPAGLTDRQSEVLVRLVDGLTNAEIAQELVLSKRTVENHVSAVLAKLGVASRAEAAGRARSLGLLGRPTG